MARKVLNKPSSGLTAAIKSVATTKTSRMSISSDDDVWYTSNGYNANLSRQENDSRVLINTGNVGVGTTNPDTAVDFAMDVASEVLGDE